MANQLNNSIIYISVQSFIKNKTICTYITSDIWSGKKISMLNLIIYYMYFWFIAFTIIKYYNIFRTIHAHIL